MSDRKAYLLLLGGLGDCFRAINNPKSIQAYFTNFLKENPEHGFEVIAGCHGPIEHLFELQPFSCTNVYSLKSEDISSLANNKVPFSDLLHRSIDDFMPHEFHPFNPQLTEEEENILTTILAQGKYFVIHPFTSEELKTPDVNWPAVCKIIHNGGYNTVVLGKSYKVWNSKEKQETTLLQGKKIYNLVNKSSLRLSYMLTALAAGFVGCDSCWFNLALFRTEFVFVILTTHHVYEDLPMKNKRNPFMNYALISERNHHLDILHEQKKPFKTFAFNVADIYTDLAIKLDSWRYPPFRRE